MLDMSQYLKSPDAVLDYSIFWGDWLPSGDSISDATWSVQEGITISKESVNSNVVVLDSPYLPDQKIVCAIGTLATVWISGGEVGTSYRITCRIVSAQGRVDERSITIRCVKR